MHEAHFKSGRPAIRYQDLSANAQLFGELKSGAQIRPADIRAHHARPAFKEGDETGARCKIVSHGPGESR